MTMFVRRSYRHADEGQGPGCNRNTEIMGGVTDMRMRVKGPDVTELRRD
jgi:hypothetical protein